MRAPNWLDNATPINFVVEVVMRFLFLFVFLFSNLSINAVASTNLRLVCNSENYSNIGYSEDWEKSWIPEEQNYNIVADKIYAIGGGLGNITMTGPKIWKPGMKKWGDEARRRGMNCGVK